MLIYPEEAWKLWGPGCIVRDATGKRLNNIIACDPVTGEVIQWISDEEFPFGSILRYQWKVHSAFLRFLYLAFGVDAYRGIYTRHYFAPAPLQITKKS